jgi:hypothetical protein
MNHPCAPPVTNARRFDTLGAHSRQNAAGI